MIQSYYVKKSCVNIPSSSDFYKDSNPLNDFQIIYRDYLSKISSTEKSEAIKDVLAKKFNQNMTLHEIGSYYGFTRERARQIVEKFKGQMKTLYSGGEIKHPYVVLKKEYFKNNHKFVEFLSKTPLYTKEEILYHIDNYYNLPTTEGLITLYLDMYLYILDFKEIEIDNNIVYYNAKKIKNIKDISGYYQAIENYLRNNILGDTSKNIAKAIKIDICVAEFMLNVMTNVEKVENNIHRIKPNFISAVDVAYRILTKKGKPLHIKDVNDELVSLGIELNVKSLGGRFTGDDRFKSVGKKSIISLTEWDKDCRTYLERMKDILEKHKKPLSTKEIRDLSGGLLRLSTIASYIQRYPETFKRVENKLVALTSWKKYKEFDVKRDPKSYLRRSTLIEITLNFFKENKVKEASVAEYFSYIKEKKGHRNNNNLFLARTKCPIIAYDPAKGKIKLKNNYKEIVKEEKKNQDKKAKKSYEGVKELAINTVKRKGPMLSKDLKKMLLATGASESFIYKVLSDPCFSKKKQGATRVLSLSKKN